MADSIAFIVRNFGNFLVGFPGQRPGGLIMTLVLAIVGVGIGMLIAILVGHAQLSRFALVRQLARSYVRIFRGIPLVLLLLLIHQFLGTGTFGFMTSSFFSALIALVLYSSAYQADIVESGLRAVPHQLVEDAQLLGSSRIRTYLDVRLPYGLRVMRPALLSQAITVFKDSSVVVVLGVADLTTTARIALGSDVTNAPHWVATYLTVGMLYFAVAFGVSQIVNKFERSAPRAVLANAPRVS
jgi:His/Glu/Gln/Arg/opine family amino acid ABC transporter permease subunit